MCHSPLVNYCSSLLSHGSSLFGLWLASGQLTNRTWMLVLDCIGLLLLKPHKGTTYLVIEYLSNHQTEGITRHSYVGAYNVNCVYFTSCLVRRILLSVRTAENGWLENGRACSRNGHVTLTKCTMEQFHFRTTSVWKLSINFILTATVIRAAESIGGGPRANTWIWPHIVDWARESWGHGRRECWDLTFFEVCLGTCELSHVKSCDNHVIHAYLQAVIFI